MHTSYIIFLPIIYAFRIFLHPQASHGCMKIHNPLITVNVERYFIKTKSYHYDPQPYFCVSNRDLNMLRREKFTKSNA